MFHTELISLCCVSFACVYVCVCVCMRVRVCMCVFVCVCNSAIGIVALLKTWYVASTGMLLRCLC